jgi:hypothetical protein
MVERLKQVVRLRRIKWQAHKGSVLAKAIRAYEKSFITKDKLMSIYFEIK